MCRSTFLGGGGLLRCAPLPILSITSPPRPPIGTRSRPLALSPPPRFARCSGRGAKLAHAAASRESMQGNRNERTRCVADGGWGGGGTQKNWQGSAPQQTSLTLTWFLVFGLLFKSTGSSLKKKKGGRQQDRNSSFG